MRQTERVRDGERERKEEIDRQRERQIETEREGTRMRLEKRRKERN